MRSRANFLYQGSGRRVTVNHHVSPAGVESSPVAACILLPDWSLQARPAPVASCCLARQTRRRRRKQSGWGSSASQSRRKRGRRVAIQLLTKSNQSWKGRWMSSAPGSYISQVARGPCRFHSQLRPGLRQDLLGRSMAPSARRGSESAVACRGVYLPDTGTALRWESRLRQ